MVSHEDPIVAIDTARHPSFGGVARLAVIDDCDYHTKATWKRIENNLPHAPATVLIACSLESVPYQIRRNATVVKLPRPAPRFIRQGLEDLTRHLGLDRDEEVIQRIADTAQSWRQANFALLHGIDLDTVNREMVAERAQPAEILTGGYSHSTCHPLSVLAMASHNGTNPNHVIDALMIHSKAWEIEGMSELSRSIIETLRADSTSNPPFRKRKITGSNKRL